MDSTAQDLTAQTGTAQAGTPQTGTAQRADPVTGRVPADPAPAPADPGPAPWTPGPSLPAGGTPPGGTSPGGKLAAYRMRRSTTDRMLAGVCGGLAADLGVDAALLRIAVLVLTLVSGGAFALVYLAAWLVAPAR